MWLLKATDYLTSEAYANQLAFIGLVALGVLLLLGIVHVSFKARRRFRLWRGKRMTRAERIQYRKMLLADIIEDGLEKAEFEGRITRWEAEREARKLGMYLQNMELIPRRLHPQQIKHHVQNKKSVVPVHDVEIPGPKPGEGENLIPFPDYLEKKEQETKKLGAAYAARKAAVA